MDAVKVVIVGAGIAGLTTALALTQRTDHEVHVYEQAPELKEVGAGIQIAPNATRLLHRLGLEAALARDGVRPLEIRHRRWEDGRVLLQQPLGDLVVDAFGVPYYHFYRPDLLALLGDALPRGFVQLNRRVTAVTQEPDGVTLTFADGATVRADAVIGADGIHSTIRELLFGKESPWFSGSVAYRGLVPAARLAHLSLDRVATTFLGADRHFVHYWVAGARLMNFVAIVPARDWRVESWSATGEVKDALAEFEGWHPQVQAIIGAAERTHRWGLYDRDPLPRWTDGRVTLLGDAAHAMLPFMAQGACQGIEDAFVLANCLRSASADTAPDALLHYQGLRQPRVNEVQRGSRQNATTYHLPDGEAQRARDAQYAAFNAAGPFAARGWLFGFDPEAAT